MVRYELAIFDYDGTLCATDQAITHTILATFDHYGEPRPERATVHRLIGAGITLEQTLKSLHPSAEAMSSEDLGAWVSTYRALYRGVGQEHTALFDGVKSLLDNLATAGVRAVVTSNKGREAIVTSLDRFGLRSYFSMILGGDAATAKKPDPATQMSFNPRGISLSTIPRMTATSL